MGRRLTDMRLVTALAFLAALTPALGQDSPPLPQPRPDTATVSDTGVPLPRRRPEPKPAEPAPEVPPEAPPEAASLPEPEPADHVAEPAEPERVFQTACPAVISGLVEAEMLPPITDGACGERSPLKVTAVLVNGRMVPLSSPVTTTCSMATALPNWVADVDGYAFSRENTRVETLITGTSYACRNVNNAESGRLSEHAFANALDVVGFGLADGRQLTLPDGWTDATSFEGRALRYAHDAACSRFTTTLGPEANALHRDHIHVDMGCHGSRCVARLCE